MLGDRRVLGFDVVLEHDAGEPRLGRALPAAYGYIRRTDSAERGDQMDCFVSPAALRKNGKPAPEGIYVVDSYDPHTGEFDEHKIFLGYDSREAALAHFRLAYSTDRVGSTLAPVSTEDLRKWLATGDVTQPYWEGRA